MGGERERKKLKRERKEEIRQDGIDWNLKHNLSPVRMFYEKISKIIDCRHCTCTAEGIRQGIICPICKLMTKIDAYTMELFRDAAHGRSTVI